MTDVTSANMQGTYTFGLLPEPERMSGSYVVSAIVNVCLLALFMILSLFALHQRIVAKQHETLTLLIPVKPVVPKPIVPKAPLVPPPPDLLRDIAPQKIVFPHTVPEEAPHMSQMKMAMPDAPVLPPYKPIDVALPPQPKVGMFHTDTPTMTANNMSKPSTRMGGFGDPTGALPNPNSNGRVSAYGSFNNAIGSQSGAGSARMGSVHGVNFGSGYANGRVGGGGHGKVSSGGFGSSVAAAGHGPVGTVQVAGFHTNIATGVAPKLANTESQIQQVQILFHPSPQYTQEAKQLRIQGEVVLEVRFGADGTIQVIRVVHGLGHGLDQQAIRAAEQTKFKPAMKDGKAVDMTTYFRIDFQLA